MNILPPLQVMKAWRDSGLSPAEVYQRCEDFTGKFRAFRRCSKCDAKHFAKGYCKKHYYQWRYSLRNLK